jgi:hypothetical protein
VLTRHANPIQFTGLLKDKFVIRLRLAELLADTSFRRGKPVELLEVA